MSQNVWKTAFILFVIFQITPAWEIVCYNGSLSNFTRVKYTNAAELITSGYYDINQKGVVYIFGYRGSLLTEGTDFILGALLKLFVINVCAVDWSTEANLGWIPYVNFPAVIAAALVIKDQLAEWLKIMWQNGMNPKTMHLMGLSMGAHLAGNAGRQFLKLTNLTIGRVTGLDPAGPGYDGDLHTERIDSTCADFVDIIYTDTGRYGMKTPLGHVNCFPNLIYYEENGVQPGCDPVNYIVNPALTPEDACSHRLALNLFVDSLIYECQLLAALAANETVWASPNFTPEVVACIGEHINQTLRGNFYMVTNNNSPYGKGEAGVRAS